uniref:Uncharacterized protein n=1 Tax=Alexandrium catenella TaxID=2925 RepID=A0A7S1RVU8_ALECA|mmetsp:Transcript_7552/g.20451  ORF Transcript_7552/g.20451 Transcript_7552/m.20451 type:complete len:164 (+) Transcript_7552:2-493(+)
MTQPVAILAQVRWLGGHVESSLRPLLLVQRRAAAHPQGRDMTHQRHGKLEGEEHISYTDKQLQSGAIIRMYQFNMALGGGAMGVRFARGAATTSLGQAQSERDRFLAVRSKKQARVLKDTGGHSITFGRQASTGSLAISTSRANPASPARAPGKRAGSTSYPK